MRDQTCRTCGTRIESGRTGGLCPACLLRDGLSAETVRREPAPHCTKCDNVLSDGSRFCAQCGAPAAAVAVEGDPIRTALDDKLRGQYRIIRLLGRGGMGAVYLARDLTLDREVAVKVIRTPSHAQETYDRFRREARTAARLSHPNIVPLHSFGEVEGMPYFVMGYVRGESLAARLQRDGRMNEDAGLRVLAEIADALDHAHRQGVVHRDIKPENVLIEDESGRALLTDFGVAKAAGRGETMTVSGGVVGTPHYMSPEQAAGHANVDGRSDIYSLGVMAFAILTGRLPFEGTSAADVLTKHLTQEPPSVRSLNGALSHTTAQAVERCLAKDPAQRWPDARSLRLALGAGEGMHLPDALHGVEGRGIPGLIVAVVWVIGFWLVGQAYGFWDDGGRIFLSLGAIGVAGIYAFVLARMHQQGFTVAQSQAAMWREPSWWLWWYPKPWRRRGNVWDRLPRDVRVVRAILPSMWLVVPPTVFGTQFIVEGYVWNQAPAIATIVAPLVAIVVVWIVADVRARRALVEQGVGGEDLNRIINSTPPSRISFWSRPHIAAILGPSADGVVARPDAPHAHLQAVLRYADELPAPFRPLATEAAGAARVLLASIEEADREIAELARSLSGGDQERLTLKIAALSGADDTPLRTLLEKERELVQGVSERIAEVQEIRSRRLEMLRTLAVHVASLRARSGETVSDTASITGRVRALCDDIARQAAGQRA